MSTSDQQFGPPWTVLKLLEWTKQFFGDRGLDSPRLEAELLLAHTLGLDRVRLYMEYDRPLVAEELDEFRALVKRRASREPVAYLTGKRAFWTIELQTDKRALIPRSDTEVVVEEVLERLPEESTATVVDVGTGTGAIALALASERPEISIVAIDASAEALALARQNVEALAMNDRVALVEGDLLAPVDEPVDYIVSNPPYVEDDAELEPDVKDHEPASALFAGPDGLDVLRRLVPDAFSKLAAGGWLTTEVGYQQGAAVCELFESAGFVEVSVRKDYGDRDRVVSGRKPS